MEAPRPSVAVIESAHSADSGKDVASSGEEAVYIEALEPSF